MAHSSKAAGGKPGDNTKRSSSNILALLDAEHTSVVANSSTYVQRMTRTSAAIPAAVTGGNRKEKSLKKKRKKTKT